jgi:hypothetical protein
LRARRRMAARGDVSQRRPEGVSVRVLRMRKARPPRKAAQRRRVVVRSITVRQPRVATSIASDAPMPSSATSLALAVREGTKD